jgi:hypothetical protein
MDCYKVKFSSGETESVEEDDVLFIFSIYQKITPYFQASKLIITVLQLHRQQTVKFLF